MQISKFAFNLTSYIPLILNVAQFPLQLRNFASHTMTTTTTQRILTNPSAINYTLPASKTPPTPQILSFHKSLPEYSPSPIISLPHIAKSLNLKNLIIKDERQRFSLPSFKPLGLAWAIRNAIISELSETLPSPLPPTISLLELASKANEAQLKLITATDAKLGKIVAKLGKAFGVESINTRIFVGDGMDEGLREEIKKEGAEVIVVEGGDFESVVREAWLHSVAVDGVLVSIDEEENYEDIPRWIVEGYSTVFQELDEQLGESPPDLVIVPVGVGGLAQAAVTHYKTSSAQSHKTHILTVESEAAASLHSSLIARERKEVETGETILKYLNYGTVAEAAWEVLQEGVDGSVIVRDADVEKAIDELKSEGFEGGPCSGAVLAALRSVIGENDRVALGLREDANVVLIATEGIAS